MNKKEVNKLIPKAYEVLEQVGIAVDGKIEKTYRSALSAFGSAVIMGNPLSAIAFFNKDTEKTSADRRKILMAISIMMKNTLNEKGIVGKEDLNDYGGKIEDLQQLFINNNEGDELTKNKNQLLESSVALKLACNLYKLSK